MNRFMISIALILFSCFTAMAEPLPVQADARNISYEKYLEVVKNNLPEIKKNRIKLLQSKNRISQAAYIDDISLNGNFNYSKNKPYTQGGSAYITDSAGGLNASVGLDKIFSYTGTKISASADYSKTDITGTNNMGPAPEEFSMSYYRPSVGISITQPLLYNFLGRLDEYGVKNARMQYEIDLVRTRMSDCSIIKYYRKIYFQWHQLNESIGILEKTIENTKKLEAQVIRKAAAGLADNDDIQKMKSSVFQYELQKNQHKKNLALVEAELSVLFDTADYHPSREEFIKLFSSSMNREYKTVDFKDTDNSRSLKLTLENLEYTFEVNENRLLPQLNLVASATQKGSEDSFSGSFGGMEDTDYYAGLSFSFPIGNSYNAGLTEETRLKIQELGEEYKATLNDYKKNMSYINSSIKLNREIYDVRLENLNALNSQYDTELTKYKQARLNLSYLIQTESSIYAENLNILKLQSDMIAMMFDYDDLTR